VAVASAKEGADVTIAYLSEPEDEDAARTAELVRAAGQRCVTIRGDLAIEDNCQRAVEQAVTELGGLDVLVNNVATQEPVDDLGELSTSQRERTFRASRCPWAGPPIPTRSPPRMSSSPAADYPATTPERYSRPSAVRHSPDDRPGLLLEPYAP
jgi:NAD(P)-dependent dehydrogenase (short-subunit alcohol dehydrogenase family)